MPTHHQPGTTIKPGVRLTRRLFNGVWIISGTTATGRRLDRYVTEYEVSHARCDVIDEMERKLEKELRG